MDLNDAFRDLFGRMPDLVRDAVTDLSDDQLATRVAPDANSIAWLIWHLSRVEDDHISGAAAALDKDEWAQQAYVANGYADRFGFPFDPADHGYGHTSEQVALVRAPGDLLRAYYEATHAKTDQFVAALDPADWEQVVDDAWDPPVTLLVRLSSVVNDVTQHVGQAAFVRGIVERTAHQP